MARRAFEVVDVTEILEHWYAGRSTAEIVRSLDVDPRTVRKYTAPAEAAGLQPGGPPIAPAVWAARVREWFPELVVPDLRHPTFAEIARHHERIKVDLEHCTATTVHQRLRDEDGLVASLASFRRYLYVHLPEEVARARVTVRKDDPPPGTEAQVDYGYLGRFFDPVSGRLRRVWAFVMVLACSRHMFVRPVLKMDLDSWVAAHVAALEFFSGATARTVIDNLKTGVLRPDLYDPKLNRTYAELAHHYGFDSFFCIPGPEGAHEKGGVEGEVGRFGRRHLVPMPGVSSLEELKEIVARGDDADDARRIGARFLTVGEHFALEAEALRPLPAEPFETTLSLSCRVDSKSRVCVRQCFYSVPARYVGRRIEVRLGASVIEALDGSKVVASHARAVAKGAESLVLDHYLEVLRVKPGALLGATALVSARAGGGFTPGHEAFWSEARRRLGDQGGTKALVEVLLAHRSLPHAAVVAGMAAALAAGSVDPAVVVVEARRVGDGSPAPVIPIGTLARYDRPVPVLDSYDTLLEASS